MTFMQLSEGSLFLRCLKLKPINRFANSTTVDEISRNLSPEISMNNLEIQ